MKLAMLLEFVAGAGTAALLLFPLVALAVYCTLPEAVLSDKPIQLVSPPRPEWKAIEADQLRRFPLRPGDPQ